MSVVLANFVDVQLYRHNQKVLDEEFSKITLSETQTTLEIIGWSYYLKMS